MPTHWPLMQVVEIVVTAPSGCASQVGIRSRSVAGPGSGGKGVRGSSPEVPSWTRLRKNVGARSAKIERDEPHGRRPLRTGEERESLQDEAVDHREGPEDDRSVPRAGPEIGRAHV